MKKIWLGILSATLLIVLPCLLYELIRCFAFSPPCPMENLMIDQTLFSEDWIQQSLPHERGAPVNWGTEKLGVGFISMRHGVAGQVTHRGLSINATTEEYFDNTIDTGWFYSYEDETEWYIPSDFTYESTVANNYRFGCQNHIPSGVQSCQFVGQYEVYLTRFHTHMSEIMTYKDLERILQAIDNKMTQCLNKDL